MMFEVLAERTLALAQLARRADPETGYEPMLEPLIRPILKRCVENGIPIIGTFGAANPLGAARLIHGLDRDEGVPSIKVGVIGRDDLRRPVAPADQAL